MSAGRTPVTPGLESYAAPLWRDVDPLLREIDDDVRARGLRATQISLEQCVLHGWLCRQFHLQTVLEIGTYLGLSAAAFALALPPEGHVDTIELDEDLAAAAEAWFRHGGLDGRITVHRGPACDVLPSLTGPYDACFIDGAKRQNVPLIRAAMARVRRNGLILVDNIFYAGLVLDSDPIPDARGARDAVAFVTSCEGLDPVLLAVADGLLVCRVLANDDPLTRTPNTRDGELSSSTTIRKGGEDVGREERDNGGRDSAAVRDRAAGASGVVRRVPRRGGRQPGRCCRSTARLHDAGLVDVAGEADVSPALLSRPRA